LLDGFSDSDNDRVALIKRDARTLVTLWSAEPSCSAQAGDKQAMMTCVDEGPHNRNCHHAITPLQRKKVSRAPIA